MAVTTADGHTRTEPFRLATTLLDCGQAPAGQLAAIYHERWLGHEVAWSEWNSQKEDRLVMSVTMGWLLRQRCRITSRIGAAALA